MKIDFPSCRFTLALHLPTIRHPMETSLAAPASLPAAFTQGWLTSAGLIIAIGAQNALVLRQGLARQHVGPVVALCAASDALLIALGVFGLGSAIRSAPWLLEAFRWGGAAFVLGYGVLALRRAVAAVPAGLAAAGHGGTRSAVLGSTLALTFLNPHVYIDTVLLLGSIGAQQGEARGAFAAGAAVASAMWFATLGYGARAAAPWLARPMAWRVLDGLVAAIMFVVAAQLLLKPLAA